MRMPRSLTASLVVTLILAAAPVAAQTKPAQPQKPPAVQPKSDQASASKKAATGNAAEFLGAKDLGTLEAGKWADLVVLQRDPLADINNSRTIESVYIAGRKVP